MIVYIELISDYVCPWCYIGKARLERLQKKLEGEITLKIGILPYVLYPHIPPGGRPKQEFSENVKPGMGRSLRTEAKEEGIELNYKLIERIPYSLEAHRLTWLVNDQTKKYALAKCIFHDYFEEGQDIESLDYLSTVATRLDISPIIIDCFLSSDGGRKEVSASIKSTKEAFISVVPSMRLDGRFMVPGLQSIDVWEKYVRRAARIKDKIE